MKLPLNCDVDYINYFLNKKESEELYFYLINHCKIEKSRFNKTDSFKILLLFERLKNKG